MGANGNTFADAAAFLGNLTAAITRTRGPGRSQPWSNVELFESWPVPNDPKSGRRPAPFSRIYAQMQNEGQ